ncbi:hypothetical protein ABID59_001722 [Bradyrhizobium sp. S3.3.6]
MIASVSPVNASAATTGMAMREKRFSSGSTAGVGFDSSAASGASAPIQNATARPWRKIAGRVSTSGGAVAACPVMASDRPTPANATAARARACHARPSAISASSIAAMATSKAGPALVTNATVQGAAVTSAAGGRPRRSRPNTPSETIALGRPTSSAARGAPIPAIDREIQRAKNTPPTPTNSPR